MLNNCRITMLYWFKPRCISSIVQNTNWIASFDIVWTKCVGSIFQLYSMLPIRWEPNWLYAKYAWIVNDLFMVWRQPVFGIANMTNASHTAANSMSSSPENCVNVHGKVVENGILQTHETHSLHCEWNNEKREIKKKKKHPKIALSLTLIKFTQNPCAPCVNSILARIFDTSTLHLADWPMHFICSSRRSVLVRFATHSS